MSYTWKKVSLDKLGKIITGKTPSTKIPDYWKGNIPFITPPDLNGGLVLKTHRYITHLGLEQVQELPKDSVLVSCIGNIGRVGIVGTNVASSNQQINSIIVDSNVADNWFCLFMIIHIQDQLEQAVQKTTVPILNKSNFSKIEISLPPLEEQQKIATVLSMVQDAIAQQEQLITLTTELKKALMHKLFTEGTRGEPQKMTEIGFVPESWDVKTLGELASKPHGCLQTGPFGSQLHKDEYQSEGIPVINPTNLAGNKINPQDVPRISLQTASRLSRHFLEVGDILFARRGEIGRHGLVGKKENGWLCGTGCFLVRVRQKFIDNRFLSYYFSTNQLISWLYKHAAGAIMPNLNNAVMKRMPVYFPNIKAQEKIADDLDLIDNKILSLQNRCILLNDLFRTLLHQLMTAQIRVDDLNLPALNLEPQVGDQ